MQRTEKFNWKRCVCRMLSICLCLALLTSCQNTDRQGNTERLNSKESTNSNAGIQGVPQNKTWWKNWPIFTNNSSGFSKADEIFAEAITGVNGCHDEGIGSLFREIGFTNNSAYTSLKDTYIKKMAWIEGYGETRSFIVGIRRDEKGAYIQDSAYDGPKIYATFWSWDQAGLGVKGSEVNTVVWSGVHSYVNNAPWLGKYIAKNDDISVPTYPDGTPALGYFDNEETPLKAKLYDALGAKDINGNFSRPEVQYDPYSNNNGKLELVHSDGKKQYHGDIQVGKDVAAPWWLEYQRLAVRYLIEKGMDGFWVDNYDGWDTINNSPIHRAFGDWSEYLFRDYLKQHPQVGIINTEDFDVVQYLKEKCKEFHPAGNPDDLNNPGWQSEKWATEPVWNAYKAFKSDLLNQRLGELKQIIKEEAKRAGRNPDDIVVTGNFGPMNAYDHMDGKIYDMASSEYSTIFHATTGFTVTGLPPVGLGGPTFSLLSNISYSANQAVVWYYADGEEQKYCDNTNLGKVAGYEAIAHNVILNGGGQDKKQIGNDTSARDVNRSISKLKEHFGDRIQYARTGIVFSQASEYANLFPGGYNRFGSIDAHYGFMGWATAFEKLNIPYRGIMDFRLKECIDELQVLILPGFRSISQKTIDEVIKPWVDKGNTLIITGEDAGAIGDKASLYMPNKTNLLEDFAKHYAGKGKIKFLQEDPGTTYYYVHLKTNNRERDLQPIKNIYEALVKEGAIQKELILEGMSNAVSVINYNKEANRYYLDLVNYNFDLKKDQMTHKLSGKALLKIPPSMDSKNIKVTCFNSKDKSFKEASYEVKDGYIVMQVPEFEFYCVYMIDAAK